MLFLIATLTLSYTFLIQGKTGPSSDGRTAIILTPGERDLVLTEMRAFLTAVQAIIDKANQKDAPGIVKAARAVGMQTAGAVPVSLMGKLPLAFKELGMGTHHRFDQLALDAEQMEDTQQVLMDLSVLLNNCIACHAAYRIEAEQPCTP
ncbi:MAG: hypothetical protein KJ558_13975 [Gammaproteobacteria bacterium]|nr:hypothetical protein [Gammaproteobacteria bacterium]MBU1655901.1 hypothetical protein [Gammaproteobacteria bacterium]MBU1961002.1 hypothetical protein [Gammaproteobacteria bacterium]